MEMQPALAAGALRAAEVAARAAALDARYAGRDGAALLAAMIRTEFPGGIALVSSFGAEAAVLLHMVARIDRATPVIFLDTGKLFGETQVYRARLVAELGLEDVRAVTPDPALLRAADAGGTLWARDADRCCFVRKVEPLGRALVGFDAWITGRKAHHGGARAALATIEAHDGRIKLNPLVHWDRPAINAYFARHDLPRHPLEAEGYPSIGCLPCTGRAAPGEGPRAGRWRGSAKTECGIHTLPAPHAQNR